MVIIICINFDTKALKDLFINYPIAIIPFASLKGPMLARAGVAPPLPTGEISYENCTSRLSS